MFRLKTGRALRDCCPACAIWGSCPNSLGLPRSSRRWRNKAVLAGPDFKPAVRRVRSPRPNVFTLQTVPARTEERHVVRVIKATEIAAARRRRGATGSRPIKDAGYSGCRRLRSACIANEHLQTQASCSDPISPMIFRQTSQIHNLEQRSGRTSAAGHIRPPMCVRAARLVPA